MTYFPQLFDKPAEHQAIARLSEDVLDNTEPCFIATPLKVSYEDPSVIQALEIRIQETVTKLRTSLAFHPLFGRKQRFFYDMGGLDPRLRTSSGKHPISELFKRLREDGLTPIPVVRLSANREQRFAV